ncbi:MAG: hypothetical protein U1D30_10700 [Planctomycetota bacterium]
MDQINYLHLVSRWFHLGSVIVLVGGAVFMRYVLMPSAQKLSDDAHDTMRANVLNIWKKFVHPLVGLIVITGIINVIAKMKETVVLYHILFTLKLILALYVLFVASALVGRSKGLEPVRKNGAKFLTINIVIAAIIVMISGVLKSLPLKEPKVDTATQVEKVQQ